MLRRNVGGLDRVLRVMFGAILFFGGLLLLSGKTTVGVAIAVVGLLALLTGIIRFCVLYIPFGISTARAEELHKKHGCNCAMLVKEALGEGNGASTTTPRDGIAQAVTTLHQGH